MIPAWVDGIIFPGRTIEQGTLWPFDYGDEAEIALTYKGCSLLWPALKVIFLAGEEYDPKPGWAKARTKLRQQSKLEFEHEPNVYAYA
jgi:hypothetical protein